MKTVKKGDIVKIKAEYQDVGDDLITFIACEDETQGLVIVQAQLGMTINPQMILTSEMIER
jgi:nitrous oxide reductase